MNVRALLAISTLAFVPLKAFALPGEAAAVAQQCGTPRAQEQVTSPVTNRLELNYYYNDLILHFQPMEGGWSFTTAWHNHLPMTRTELEERLPCFKTAMNQVAVAPLPVEDPTIAEQTAVAPVDDNTFGIPHLWMIVALVVLLLVGALIPSRRRALARKPERPRVWRQPSLRGILPRRRKPAVTE